MSEHEVSVIDEYRRTFSWTARCSCGWSESYSLAMVAERVAQEHLAASEPTTGGGGADRREGE